MKKILTFIQSPLGLLLSISGGFVFGKFYPIISSDVSYIGELFVKLIKVCIIPIVLFSVILSINKIASVYDPRNIRTIVRFLVLSMVVLLVLPFFLSMMPANYFQVNMDANASELVRNIAESSSHAEMELNDTFEKKRPVGLIQIILKALPDNIFKSFTSSFVLQVVVFASIFGMTMSFVDKTENMIRGITKLNEIFFKIFSSALTFLPFAVFFLIARDTNKIDNTTIEAMGLFLLINIVVFFAIFVFLLLSCCFKYKRSPIFILKTLQKSMTVSFITQSSYSAIPILIKELMNLKIEQKESSMYIPFAISMFRPGSTIYFCTCAIFVFSIYSFNYSLMDQIYIALLCLLAGLSSIGSTGVLSLVYISTVTSYFNIPSDVIIFLFIAIDPIIDPIRTLLNSHLNTFNLLLAIEKEKK